MNLRNKIRAMKVCTHLHTLSSGEEGAELIEFAFVLPFLFVLLVGVMDFGGAWAVRDKIAGAVRDGARVAVATFNDSTNPQCGGTSCAVQAAADATIETLNNANVDTCGMTGAGMAATGAPFTWRNTVVCGNGGRFRLTVARAVPEVDGSSGANVQVLTTQVTITYPYTFRLVNITHRLLRLFFGGPSPFTNVVDIGGEATMANLN